MVILIKTTVPRQLKNNNDKKLEKQQLSNKSHGTGTVSFCIVLAQTLKNAYYIAPPWEDM